MSWREILGQFEACDDYASLRRAIRAAKKRETAEGLPEKLVPVRIGLIGGATHDHLADALRVALLVRGVAPEFHVGGYDQYVRDMTDPGSGLRAFEPRIVIVVNTPFNVGRWPDLGASAAAASALADAECDALLAPCRALHEAVGCDVVLNTLHPPPNGNVGNLGAKLPGDRANFVRRVNLILGDRAPPFVHLNDVASLAARHGLDHWFDARYWFHAKHPLAFDAIPEYVRNTAALVGALLGRSKKCLVLDLDNTLWGGVIGDDGIAGIALGEGTAAGEAFKSFQTYCRRLMDRGIVLAVASKNDEHTAREAFDRHPEMVLRFEDFVAFEANWGPKSDSLRRIATRLDLGLDSFVFADDNPAERDLVRREVPEVAVVDLPDDPAGFPAAIDAGRWFEPAQITAEDSRRTDTYRGRAAATDAEASATDMNAYLASLDMVAVIRPFEDASLPRITQLTNKTNQFNLTTERVTASEIEKMATDPARVTRSLRLSDRFGDHGLVSVFFARVNGTMLDIDGWLMSCRVLKRDAEVALFEDVLRECRDRGVETIVGHYLPTERNGMVADHYRNLGFSLAREAADGETRWELDVASAAPPEHHIRVETSR